MEMESSRSARSSGSHMRRWIAGLLGILMAAGLAGRGQAVVPPNPEPCIFSIGTAGNAAVLSYTDGSVQVVPDGVIRPEAKVCDPPLGPEPTPSPTEPAPVTPPPASEPGNYPPPPTELPAVCKGATVPVFNASDVASVAPVRTVPVDSSIFPPGVPRRWTGRPILTPAPRRSGRVTLPITPPTATRRVAPLGDDDGSGDSSGPLKPYIDINGHHLCGDGQNMILVVNADGGGRFMIRADILADQLTTYGQGNTLGVLHEPFILRDEDANTLRYANLSNRHNQVMFSSGDSQVRHWAMSPDTGDWDDGEFSSADVRSVPGGANGVPGTTDHLYIPLRWVIEGLGGAVLSTDQVVQVTYADEFNYADWRMAEGLAPGAKAAFGKKLLTVEQIYTLGDTLRFIAYRDSQGDILWARQNPWLFIRHLGIQLIAKNGRRLTDREYEQIAALVRIKLGDPIASAGSVTALGNNAWTGDDVKQLINLTDKAVKVMQAKFGLKESGVDPVTGLTVDFSAYNRQHAQNPFHNGPDQIFVVTNWDNIIQRYAFPEIKITMRPYVRPSKFKENSPLDQQVARMLKWKDPIVRKAGQDVNARLLELHKRLEKGTLTLEQYEAEFQYLFPTIRVTSSPQGGISRATKTLWNSENTLHSETNFEANLPPEGNGLYKMAPPGGDDDDKPEGITIMPFPIRPGH